MGWYSNNVGIYHGTPEPTDQLLYEIIALAVHEKNSYFAEPEIVRKRNLHKYESNFLEIEQFVLDNGEELNLFFSELTV